MAIELIRSAPLGLFCIHPETVGQRSDYVLGKKSGLGSITLMLDDLGLAADDDQRAELLQLVKSRGIENRGPVDDSEFRSLHATITGDNRTSS